MSDSPTLDGPGDDESLLQQELSRLRQALSDAEQREQLLTEEVDNLRHLYDRAPLPYQSLDENGRFLAVNDAWLEALGYSREEVIGRNFAEFLASPGDALFAARFPHFKAVGRIQDYEFEMVRKDGSTITVLFDGRIGRDQTGRFVQTHCIFRDITGQRQLEAALRASELRLQTVVDSLREVVLVVAPDHTILSVNAAVEQVFGYRRAELAGQKSSILHADQEHASAFWRMITPVYSGEEETVRYEYVGRRKNGEIFPTENTISAIRDERGNIKAIAGIVRDISLRKKGQQALIAERERLFAVLDAIPGFVVVISADYRIRFTNRYFRDLFGEPEDRPCYEVLHGRSAPCEACALPEVLATRTTLEREFAGPGDRIYRIRGHPFRDVDGSWQILALGTDVTEQHEIRERLVRAQRLEIAGRVAGQVAHDFNNLLGPMVGYPTLIKSELPPTHPAVDYCDAMLEAARQMADISGDMLLLSRRGLLKVEAVDLNGLLRRRSQSLLDGFDSLTVEYRLAEGLMPVSGSPEQLQRVINNLISNASEAMGDSGRLTLTTENIYLDSPFGRYNRVDPGEYVRLQVTDSGPGIPQQIRANIFDPFFSTKVSSRKRGTGLGLAIVLAVLEDHHGYVDFESEDGTGTTFSVYLPAYREAASADLPPHPIQEKRSILIVDDDRRQLEVIGRLLASTGHELQLASSGEEALSLLADHHIDLLLLDMIMPNGIDGLETYRRALEIRPGQKAILMSGSIDLDTVPVAQRLGPSAFLPKPMRKEQLTKAIQAVLQMEP